MNEDPDPRVIGFDSAEQAFAWMAEQEAKASADTLPEQWAITWGDRVVRIHDRMPIWGHLYTEEEFLADNGDDEESRYELDTLRESHLRGYRYGKWYSEVEPTGEYGSAHVINLWKVSERDFERARLLGWQIWFELMNELSQEMGEAITKKDNQGRTP